MSRINTTVFKEQVAVVTGASSGIGKAIALELAAQGAKLCLLGRKLESLFAIAKIAQETSPQVRCYQLDLTLDEDIRQFKAHVDIDYGQVDLLIHSAGVYSLGEVKTASVQDFDLQYQTNVRAPYILTQALLPNLLSSQGQVVFINSTAGLIARAGVSQYAATKHALKAIADSLRDEVNPLGVRVLTVFPGNTASPMQAAICEMLGKPYNPERLIQPEDVASVVVHTLSLPRTAEVTEIKVRPFLKS
ncbi:SDR family oxidoreductase [Aetokthonos hydrillicola Thurmond2011]|jgi:NADP-dependent 3-hydroxy acid dehydrogenase YdfG|uniref:SDR family oxidoreductase n=1 Tax=Aetokthonos hydrillicola Thurmond2011 TaxID=2712845 RepID=A0AAP5MAY2_9CYAN|nr:SDR family oxidoreductase [Aetokthonos hydrillicola]MBO3457159.1 SDR family oxidoreductase [Aetokthonos hydrillicola CCALA 1050]MBW4587510.1 SDR family oxidoreductase [Aetokthonos hydrillicola CCALA 1050]MDR9898625.1 SDR family oxidoreductase [Aetokthonos hydrillicola Thurmond2011]